MNSNCKLLALLSMLLLAVVIPTSAVAAEGSDPGSYSLQFQATGELDLAFSVMAVDKFSIHIDHESDGQRVNVIGDGIINSLPNDKLLIEYQIDLQVEKPEPGRPSVIKAKGAVVTSVDTEVILFNAGSTALKLVLVAAK